MYLNISKKETVHRKKLITLLRNNCILKNELLIINLSILIKFLIVMNKRYPKSVKYDVSLKKTCVIYLHFGLISKQGNTVKM